MDHLKPGVVNAAPTSVAPAVRPVRWSGRKTAVAAALAVGMATVGGGAVAAAAPTINTQLQGGHGGPGGMGGPGGPGGMGGPGAPGQAPGMPGQQGQAPQQGQGQVPGMPGQAPGGVAG